MYALEELAVPAVRSREIQMKSYILATVATTILAAVAFSSPASALPAAPGIATSSQSVTHVKMSRHEMMMMKKKKMMMMHHKKKMM
jgi:hypothetical protein